MSLFDIFKKNDPYKDYKHSRETADDVSHYVLVTNEECEKEKKSKEWAYNKIIDYALPKFGDIDVFDLSVNLFHTLYGFCECPPLKMLLLDEIEERIRTGKIRKDHIECVARKSNHEIWCFNPLLSELDIPCEHKKEFSESKYSICKDTCKYRYSCLYNKHFRYQDLRDSQDHQNNIMDIYKKFRKHITENKYFIYEEDYRDRLGEHAFKLELEEHYISLYRVLDGYVKEIHAYLVKNNSELKIGHLVYLCDIFLVENDDLKRKPFILVPLGLEVLDYIKDRDEERYDRIFAEKREIIRDYYFNP